MRFSTHLHLVKIKKVKNDSTPPYTFMMWTGTLYPFWPLLLLTLNIFHVTVGHILYKLQTIQKALQMNTIGSNKYISHAH